MVNPDLQGRPVPRGLSVQWPAEFEAGFAISNGATRKGEPRSHRLLVWRVHIVALANVEGDGHACIDHMQASPLAIANETPIFSRRLKARDLHKKEGKVAQTPLLPPVSDQCGEQFCIQVCAIVSAVGLPLVPEKTLDGIRSERRNHPVVEPSGYPGRWVRVPGVRGLRQVMSGGLRIGLLL